MTFPTIPTSGANTLLTTNQATATTTHTFPSLTTLDNASGDLLLAIIVKYDGASTDAEFSSWGGSFTEFVDRAQSGTNVPGAIGAAYKFSDGTETGTFTVTSAGSHRSVMFLLSVKLAHTSTPPEATTRATGTTAAADPASLSPSWGAADTLWIAVANNDETSLTGSFTGITAAPTNYGSYFDSGIIGGDVIGALEGALAFRQNNAASEDAGGFTLDTGAAANSALVIAVRPAPAVEVPPPILVMQPRGAW